jgi:tripartite-type tricarboxylate transporter receptor subunit TctC
MRGFYAAVLLILAGVAVAEPQTHPSRPITPIVPLPLGSSTDAAARIMAERMRISAVKHKIPSLSQYLAHFELQRPTNRPIILCG